MSMLFYAAVYWKGNQFALEKVFWRGESTVL
ncbi:MAG: hypothetical protein JWQ85_1178 [Mucilaginibacter sp.]|nr:hypothetical protein [Mucilaginibacter sp.]